MFHQRPSIIDCGLLMGLSIFCPYVLTETFGQSKIVYEWTTLELDWPSVTDKVEALRNGSYVPERNVIAGIKVYKDNVFLTVPRWKWTSGVPMTLAKVITVQGQPKLQPFPNWAAQKQGDCRALQYVQSMEIDTNTGLLYAIDTGRVGIGFGLNPLNLCPPKLVVFDLSTKQEVDRYEFPENVVSRDNNFINDIVLHYVNGRVKYAYISDVSEGLLHIYDFETRSAHNFEDPSMLAEGGNVSVVQINGEDYNFQVDVDGIAISSDFQYLYFCALSSYNLYQIPTSALTAGAGRYPIKPRIVGRKVSQSGGIAFGSKRLYYGAMGLNAVYYWDLETDQLTQMVSTSAVKMVTQTEVVRNDSTMQWPDTFAFDNKGWLWFVSNRLQLYVTNSMDFTGRDSVNMRVWKVYVNETSYLYGADIRTRSGVLNLGGSVGGSGMTSNISLLAFLFGLVIAGFRNICFLIDMGCLKRF